MEPILSALQQNAAQTLAKPDLGANLPNTISNGGGSNNRFFDILATKNTEQMDEIRAFAHDSLDMNGLTGLDSAQSVSMDSISMDNVNLSVEGPTELSGHAVETDKSTLQNYFSEVNGNLNQMDGMVDIINSGTPLTQRDLIAMQVFISRSSLTTEVFTRSTEQVGKVVMNLFNMQV